MQYGGGVLRPTFCRGQGRKLLTGLLLHLLLQCCCPWQRQP